MNSHTLEHIAFDCYAGIEEGIEDVIYGYSDSVSSYFKMTFLSKQFFNNEQFVSSYKKFLKKFSQEEYMNSIVKKYEASSDSLSNLLKNEFPNYEFDMDYLMANAKAVRELLVDYDSSYDFVLKPLNYDYGSIDDNFFPSIGVKANKYINDKNELVLKIKNFHLDTIYLLGYSNNEKNRNNIVEFKESILLAPFQMKGDILELKVIDNYDFIYFRPQNTSHLEVTEIEKSY